MEDLVPAYLAVKQIVSERKPYSPTLFKILQTEKVAPLQAKKVKAVVYGVLNNYNKLCFDAMNVFTEYKKGDDETFLNIVALYQLRVLKDDQKIIANAYVDAFNRLRLSGDAKANAALLTNAIKTPFKIPDEVKALPLAYDSLTLEMPEFLLGEMFKELGGETAVKLSLELHKKPVNFYAANLFIKPMDNYVNDKRFTAIKLSDGQIIYKDTGSVLPKELKTGELYRLDYIAALAYAEVSIPSVSPRILFTDSHYPDSGIYFAMKTKDFYGATILTSYSNPLTYRLAIDEKQKLNLNTVSPLLSPVALIKTYQEYDNFDLVVNEGYDSLIGTSRKHPGSLPSLTKKHITNCCKKQLADLLESSEFVKKEGYLLFINSAILNNEGHDIVQQFLNVKKNFGVIKEKYVYPMEMDSDGGYYCLLRRDN
ncbi:MAG: hypothetical protein WCR56_00195 [Bacilli bacterium]|jgi:hypothetical protein